MDVYGCFCECVAVGGLSRLSTWDVEQVGIIKTMS